MAIGEQTPIIADQSDPLETIMTTTPPRIAPVAVTVNEFCAATGIGRTHLYKQVKAGRIKIKKSGRRTLIPVTEIQAYLARLG